MTRRKDKGETNRLTVGPGLKVSKRNNFPKRNEYTLFKNGRTNVGNTEDSDKPNRDGPELEGLNPERIFSYESPDSDCNTTGLLLTI